LHNDRYVKPTPAGSRRAEAEDGGGKGKQLSFLSKGFLEKDGG